jgi:hypothetical protein
LEEIIDHVGYEVLMEVDDNSVPVVGNPQWILG